MDRRGRRIVRQRRGPRPEDVDRARGGARPLVDGDEGFITVPSGVRLWYRVRGAGPDVVIVACTGNADDFVGFVPPDRCVVLFDARNRGRSDHLEDPAQLGFSADVNDLDAVRRAFGIDRFSGVGTAYQAGVMATYAMQHPDRVARLVLVSPIPTHSGVQPREVAGVAPHQLAAYDQLVARGLRERDPASLCRAWREMYVPLLMGEPSAYADLADPCGCENEWPWRVAESLVFVFAQLGSYDWRPPLRELEVPSLVVFGSEDHYPAECAHEWVDALRESRLLLMDGVGQFPWVERPAIFFDAVNRFLAGERI